MNQPANDYLFKSLLEAVPLPLFVVNRDFVVTHSNQHGLHLSEQASLHEGTRLETLIAYPQVLHFVRECMRTGLPQRELVLLDTTGDGAWKVLVKPLFDQEPQPGNALLPQFFALIIEDVTEPRRMERMQRDFLANISHELRTPLSSVSLLTETLEDVIDTNPDKAQEFVEKIEKELHYLIGMVSELLELSRMEAGQLPITIEPIEAASLVHEVLARMLPQAQRHRINLTTQVAQGRTLVAADSKLIIRVLVNLVHNAIKFTSSGGSIVVGTFSLPNQQMQQFFVRDTGVGIRPEDLPRVFERFYKTSRSRSKENFVGPGGGGTGLGLAIARQVVEAHGGRMKAESVHGEGSVFSFTLPVALRLEPNPSENG